MFHIIISIFNIFIRFAQPLHSSRYFISRTRSRVSSLTSTLTTLSLSACSLRSAPRLLRNEDSASTLLALRPKSFLHVPSDKLSLVTFRHLAQAKSFRSMLHCVRIVSPSGSTASLSGTASLCFTPFNPSNYSPSRTRPAFPHRHRLLE